MVFTIIYATCLGVSIYCVVKYALLMHKLQPYLLLICIGMLFLLVGSVANYPYLGTLGAAISIFAVYNLVPPKRV